MNNSDLNKIKMIVCDMDGTLLYSSSKLTEFSRAALRQARSQGYVFGICSGRPMDGLKRMLKIWGIEEDVDFLLGFNGGSFYHEGKLREWKKLDAKTIREIIESFSGYPIWFAEYHGHTLYATMDNPILRRMAKRNQLEFRKASRRDLERPSSKLMAVGMPWTISRYEKQGKLPDGCRMFRSGPFLLEIVHPELSKLEGVKRAAKEYGVSLDEVLSFGNDNNDLEMLEGTVGVAMDNALENVKEAACYITESNRKDGVARFLYKHLLHQNDQDPDDGSEAKKEQQEGELYE